MNRGGVGNSTAPAGLDCADDGGHDEEHGGDEGHPVGCLVVEALGIRRHGIVAAHRPGCWRLIRGRRARARIQHEVDEEIMIERKTGGESLDGNSR